MSNRTSNFVHRVKRRINRAERASPATLAEIRGELGRAPTAELWILLGDAIQLSDGDEYELEDAETSYRRAIDLDPLSANAYESLAFFMFAVKANTRESIPLFQRAIELGAGASARDGLNAAVNDLAEDDDFE